MSAAICPFRFRWSFMKKRHRNIGKMQILRCRMRWKMSSACPALARSVIRKENISKVRKPVHRKYRGRLAILQQNLQKKQQKRNPTTQQLPKRKLLQQRKSLQNRTIVAVSKKALAESGISGIVVLIKDPTIRMWYTAVTSRKRPSVSNRSWVRWEKLSFVDRFCLWTSARSVGRKQS